LRVSFATNRSNATNLEDARLTGNACVFLNNLPAKTGPVVFYLDGTLRRSEGNPPWDFNGGDAATCTIFNFGALSAGSHTIRAIWSGGSDTSTFVR
jgi:hypothetical protein